MGIKSATFAAGLLALSLATPSFADAQIRIRMGFPSVLPPLVEVEPGVQVVQDYDEEIFFTGGYYWVQRDGYWYRSHDHRGYWRRMDNDRLPRVLIGRQPGQYRRWQHDEHRNWPAAQRGHGSPKSGHWQAQDRHERGPERQHRQEGRHVEHQKSGNPHEGGQGKGAHQGGEKHEGGR